MKTSYYIGLLLLVGGLSCKRTSDQIQPTLPEVNQEEKYTLLSITYTALPGSSEGETIEQRPNLEYANQTNLRQKVVVDPGGIFERSTFRKDTNQSYQVDDQGQVFPVPIDIQNNQVSLGAKKWRYAEEETKLPTSLVFKDSVYVESGKKLTGKLSMTYRKLQASYAAQLKGNSSGRLVTLHGTWTGLYPVKKNFTYAIQDL
ncbi:hypothetical protein [Spirosoma pomorum]